jgi:Arc/MetJ family transcription regulator
MNGGSDMRTTINVEDGLFESVMEMTEAKTKTAAINRALTDYVRLKRIEHLKSLAGKVRINDSWKKTREMEKRER